MHLSRIALFCSLSLSALATHAASLDTQPEPGLWISESTTLINGIDMQARMREMRENMLKTLPPEQRALAGTLGRARRGSAAAGRHGAAGADR